MKYLVFIIGLSGFLLAASDAQISMSKSVGSASQITVVDSSEITDSDKKHRIFKIFLADLRLSGNFNPSSTYQSGSFESQITQKTPYVLKYRLDNKSGGVELMVKLLKSNSGENLFSKSYVLGNAEQYPFLIHKSISDINKAMGYGDISWMNKFVIISKSSSSGKSQIVLSDYTMTYNRVILSGGLNIFPKWANNAQNKFYMTNMSGVFPSLYSVDMNSGAKSLIAKSEGMLVCSDVDKNSDKILLTMAPNSQPDIYELTLSSGSKKQITDYSGIDVSGRYGQNSEIMFVSNRSGNANIYKKTLNSSSVTKATNYGSYNNTFDSYGSKIVYSSKESRGAFNLYLQNSTNGKPIPLTTGGDNQYPKLLSSGNIVAFVKQQGDKSKIGYININTLKTEFFDFNGKIQSIDW